jgi:hypothetical protein
LRTREKDFDISVPVLKRLFPMMREREGEK